MNPEQRGPIVMVVDDDEAVRATLVDLLMEARPDLEIVEAASGEEAWDVAQSVEPAVVFSDMRMPGIDGIELLERFREHYPATIRILITGYAEVDSAQKAVNRGRVFRFLTKPANTETVVTTLNNALDERVRGDAEARVMGETLGAAVHAITLALELTDQSTFGRTNRVLRVTTHLARALNVPDPWTVEMAATLSQLGWLGLDSETAQRLAIGADLTDFEQDAVQRTAAIGSDIVAEIPRLGPIADILKAQEPEVELGRDPEPRELSLHARVLRVARDFESLLARGCSPDEAYTKIERFADVYGEDVVAALRGIDHVDPSEGRVEHVPFRNLRVGMETVAPILSTDGTRLLGEGYVVTPLVLERLFNIARGRGVQEPLIVRIW